MAAPRRDTVGSMVRHGDFVSMTLQYHLGNEWKWECSCGAVADRFRKGQFPRVMAALDWLEHVDEAHADVNSIRPAVGPAPGSAP